MISLFDLYNKEIRNWKAEWCPQYICIPWLASLRLILSLIYLWIIFISIAHSASTNSLFENLRTFLFNVMELHVASSLMIGSFYGDEGINNEYMLM